jgi:hypothetical protein
MPERIRAARLQNAIRSCEDYLSDSHFDLWTMDFLNERLARDVEHFLKASGLEVKCEKLKDYDWWKVSARLDY